MDWLKNLYSSSIILVNFKDCPWHFSAYEVNFGAQEYYPVSWKTTCSKSLSKDFTWWSSSWVFKWMRILPFFFVPRNKLLENIYLGCCHVKTSQSVILCFIISHSSIESRVLLFLSLPSGSYNNRERSSFANFFPNYG